MARRETVSDATISAWILEDSGSEGDFSEESDNEELSVENDVSSSESEASDEEEIEDDTQNVGSGWQTYRDSDGDLMNFPYRVNKEGFILPVSARPTIELEYFQMFFSDELISEIVAATNAYAAEKIQKVTPLQKHSMWHTWKDVSVEEMKAFFGVIINMALNTKAELVDYFSENWLDRTPFFKDVFSRLRFFQIFWMLHLVSPVAAQGVRPRGSKIRNVSEYIDTKCKELYAPGKNVAIDESTVGFKGRIQFKCYNPKKPTKWGLRIYCLCDSENGYIFSHIPYYGKTTTESLIRPDLPFTARVVVHLAQTLQAQTGGLGYHIFTDRFYTSPLLAEELRKMKIHLTGTVMTSRKDFPRELKNKKLQEHEIRAYQNDMKVMCLSFKDKRLVNMLSTFFGPQTQLVTGYKKKERIEFEKPRVILEYTKFMGGVDRADQFCGCYAFTRKSYKWWKKLFFWLIEVSIVNSYILYSLDKKEKGEKAQTHLSYRRHLVTQLVGNVRNRNSRKRGRPSSFDTEERLNGKQHFIMQNEKKSTKDCMVCSNRKEKGGRRETSFYCETCIRKPGLHPGLCFKKYHTEINYKQIKH